MFRQQGIARTTWIGILLIALAALMPLASQALRLADPVARAGLMLQSQTMSDPACVTTVSDTVQPLSVDAGLAATLATLHACDFCADGLLPHHAPLSSAFAWVAHGQGDAGFLLVLMTSWTVYAGAFDRPSCRAPPELT